MKRILLIIPVLLLSLAACKKNRGPANSKSVQPDNNLDSLVSMSAYINGKWWQTDSAYGSYVMHSTNDSGINNVLITATRKKNDSISTIIFNITNYTGPNTYTITPPLNTATYYFGNARHYATSGQIVITSDTGYSLLGAFNFVADSITVTGGVFNISLP